MPSAPGSVRGGGGGEGVCVSKPVANVPAVVTSATSPPAQSRVPRATRGWETKTGG